MLSLAISWFAMSKLNVLQKIQDHVKKEDIQRLEMVDRRANIRAPLKVEPVPKGTYLNLAPIEIALLNLAPVEIGNPYTHRAMNTSAHAEYNDGFKSQQPEVASTSVGAPCDENMGAPTTNVSGGEFKTFQQYSQAKSQEASAKTKPQVTPEKYKKIIDKYPDLLKTDFHSDKPPKHGIVHNIDTGDSLPCTAKARPLMPGSPKAVQGKKDWENLEKLGIVERVPPHECNFWTSAIHLVPKPDGTIRCCGDFRLLNDKTLLDGYPLPNLKAFTDKMTGASIFSKIDLTKAFHQIPLSKSSQIKTTMVTPWGKN